MEEVNGEIRNSFLQQAPLIDEKQVNEKKSWEISSFSVDVEFITELEKEVKKAALKNNLEALNINPEQCVQQPIDEFFCCSICTLVVIDPVEC